MLRSPPSDEPLPHIVLAVRQHAVLIFLVQAERVCRIPHYLVSILLMLAAGVARKRPPTTKM